MRQGWPIHLYHRRAPYIIKSPPIAEKARSSRDRILCVASSREANQRLTQFDMCVLMPAQTSLFLSAAYLRACGRATDVT